MLELGESIIMNLSLSGCNSKLVKLIKMSLNKNCSKVWISKHFPLFELKWHEVTWKCKRLHNDELYALFSSQGTYGGEESCIESFGEEA
jgi:hypothetical protein